MYVTGVLGHEELPRGAQLLRPVRRNSPFRIHFLCGHAAHRKRASVDGFTSNQYVAGTSMTLHHALRKGWHLVSLNYDRAFAFVERQCPDSLRERALALR
jgi:hypothetical protein